MTSRVLSLLALLAVATPASAQAPDFERSVLPVLERNCFKCHAQVAGKRRVKGGLRLDGVDWIAKGGLNGRVLVPGKPEQSPLYTRMVLPDGHEDIMPPKGDPVSDREADLVFQWIRAGADYGGWKGIEREGGPDAKPATTPRKEGEPAAVVLLRELGDGVPAPDAAAVERAAGDVAQITPVLPGSPLLRVQFLSNEHEVKSDVVRGLAPIAAHVTQLRLARTKVRDDDLRTVSGMKRLTWLDLSKTRVTDAGLPALAGLPELRTLNLYGTKVTDEGLEVLARLPELDTLYLFDTEATTAGVERLRKARPDLRVQFERDLPGEPPRRGEREEGRRRR